MFILAFRHNTTEYDINVKINTDITTLGGQRVTGQAAIHFFLTFDEIYKV
jgi:hypothetical protein